MILPTMTALEIRATVDNVKGRDRERKRQKFLIFMSKNVAKIKLEIYFDA